MDNMMSTDSLDPPSQPSSSSSSTHFAATNMTVRRRSKMACDTCHYRKIKCNVERCYPCKNCEKNSVQCTMVGPSMRPPRSISGSSSAAAAAAVAMAMATVANARLSACGGANGLGGLGGGGGGGYNFEGGPLDQDVNPTTFRNTSHHNNHHHQADDRNGIRMATHNVNVRMEEHPTMGMFNPLWAARAGVSARGSEATSSRSVEPPTTAPAGALSHSHRKLHAYSSPSPTIPPPSRGTFPLGAPSPTEHLSGHARTQQSPQLSIATTSRYISSTPTPGAHEMVSDSKRLAGYDYFNLPLTQSAASTPSVASPSFTTQTRSFAQLSLLDDSSLSASLPPTPTQSHFEKYGDGFDPSSLYKAPVPLYPTQTSQPPHRLSGQPAPPVQHNKQLRTTSISPHPQGSRDFRHQPFGFPDRRSSLPWDARISSHFGSLESRGSGGTKGGSRQQHGSSTISSASTIPGYKGRERHSLPQSLLVRSNSTPAIFGLPSTPMTTLEQHQQQQLQQVHINAQQGWNAIRPKVECDMNAASTTTPSTIVERIAPQDLLAAPGGHCSSTFERSFHNNNTQGQQAVMQGIQKSTPRGSISSTTGGVPRQQDQQQIRVQRSFSQEDIHQQQQQQQAGEPWASLTGLDTFEGSVSADTQLHRPTGHPLVFDTIGNERNDAASQQQQQQQQPYQAIQHHQHLPQSAQHGQQHPLSLKVEDLDDDNFDSSLAMVLDDHLCLMDHLSMMPDVEVYQSQMPNAAVPMMRSAEQHQQQGHKIIIPSSSSGPSGGHHPHHYRFQGPMSAPAISAHHQNLFGTSDLYPSSTTTSTSNTAVRSNGYTVMSESSIPSPVSPEDPTTALGGGGCEMELIKQEFGTQPSHSHHHHHHHQQQQHQQQQHSMLYFDNSSGLVLNDEGPQIVGSNHGGCSGVESNGDGNTGSNGGRSFGYVQDTSFMHIKVEPDLELDNQHLLQQQHHHHHQHQQQHASPPSSSHYAMDRQHPFDATPVQHQHPHQNHQQHQHQHQQQHQGGRLNQSTAPISSASMTHGVPILVAEYSHRPHQQQQQ